MHRDYTITPTMNAWPVVHIGDMSHFGRGPAYVLKRSDGKITATPFKPHPQKDQAVLRPFAPQTDYGEQWSGSRLS
jgi:hypothetical protein